VVTILQISSPDQTFSTHSDSQYWHDLTLVDAVRSIYPATLTLTQQTIELLVLPFPNAD